MPKHTSRCYAYILFKRLLIRQGIYRVILKLKRHLHLCWFNELDQLFVNISSTFKPGFRKRLIEESTARERGKYLICQTWLTESLMGWFGGQWQFWICRKRMVKNPTISFNYTEYNASGYTTSECVANGCSVGWCGANKCDAR